MPRTVRISLEVRREPAPGSYKAPRLVRAAARQSGLEANAVPDKAPRAATQGGQSMPADGKSANQELRVRKPGPHAGH